MEEGHCGRPTVTSGVGSWSCEPLADTGFVERVRAFRYDVVSGFFQTCVGGRKRGLVRVRVALQGWWPHEPSVALGHAALPCRTLWNHVNFGRVLRHRRKVMLLRYAPRCAASFPRRASRQGYYFTGDGCRRDSDGFYWITGRVDDVLNVSGHRIGTAEVGG